MCPWFRTGGKDYKMKIYNIEEAAARIRNLREIHGYKQEQAADLLSVDRRHIARIEAGTRGCSLDMLIRLSELYDVSLDYLVFGKDTDAKVLTHKLDSFMRQIAELRDSI